MTPPLWLGSLLGLASLTSLTCAAWTMVALALPVAEPRVRVVGTIIGVVWLHAILFYVLVFTGAFALVPGVASCVVPGLVSLGLLWRVGWLRRILAADVGAMRAHFSTMFGPTTSVATIGFGTVAGLQFMHAILAPPLAWDALTYHLTRAAFWVQNGDLSNTFGAPLAWEYFHAFWPIGDSWSAWALLFTHTDTWIPLAWALVWLMGVACSYALARELRAPREHAWVGALAVWSIPAMARHAYVAHIENMIWVLVVGGVTLLLVSARSRSSLAAMIGLAGLGLSAAIKLTALPYAAAAAVAFGWIAATRLRHQKWRLALAPLPGLLASIPTFVHQYLVYGSPVHPFRLRIAGITLFEPGEGFATVLAREPSHTPLEYAERLFLDGPYGGYVTHVNFGIVSAVLMVLGLIGLVRLWKKGPGRVTITIFCAFAALAVYKFLTTYPSTGNNVARHIAAVPLLLAATASAIPNRRIGDLLAVVMFGNLVFWLPFNWHEVDENMLWGAMPWLAIAAAAAVATAYALWRFPSRRLAATLAVAWCVAVAVGAGPLEQHRSRHRYELYRAAGKQRTYTNIRLGGAHGISFGSSKLWEKIDDPDRPHKVAVTAGWDKRGINWAVYPIFGRRLQNELVYVSPTERGEQVDRRDKRELRKAAEYEVWRDRLIREGVDYVVLYYPTTREARWIRSHRRDFRIVVRDGRRKVNMLAKPLSPE